MVILFHQQKYYFARYTLKLLSIPLLLALTLSNITQPALATNHKPNSATIASANVPNDRGFARAQVSVVRLLTTFKASGKPDAPCTGLGVLIASNDVDGTKQTPSTLWVLTDSSLVSGQCLANQTNETLASAKMYFNTAYTGDAQQGSEFLIMDSSVSPRCTNGKCEPNQAAFLSFQGKASPFLAFSSSSQTAKSAISLPLMSNEKPGTLDPASLLQLATKPLTPQLVNDTTTSLEPGTPFIDADGRLVGIQSTNGQPMIEAGRISTFIGKGDGPDGLSANPSNQVNTHWKAGIDAFYKQSTPDYQTACTEFEKAHQVNAAFKNEQYHNLFLGGQVFISEAQRKLASANGTPTAPGTSPSSGDATPLWLVSILLSVVLIIVVVVGSLVIRSQIRKRRQFQAQLKQLEPKAEMEARKLREQDARRAQTPHFADQPTIPVNPQLLQAAAGGNRQIHCPSCKASIPGNAHYCPKCYQFLSPSDSGISKRLVLQSEVYASSSSYSVPVNSVSEQPTLQQLPTLDSSEHPTVELRPETTVKRFSDLADEKTRIISSKPLSFIVGAKSDPGIKRRYKPNEDSFLAAQGLISAPSPQPFGLFVVADGMGGHANGQDASRLAIQSIVNNILPKLVSGQAEIVDYAQVIKGGIQSANQAVYQHNKDQRADMGTTVTAALVVGDTAYVVNVGDSRTYLYHESEGLRKVTKDHSVVASLVDAGIIKYDDIYTHPKRNQIYRSLGEKENVEIDFFPEKLHEGDKLLLCSDGLWDMVRDPQIEEVIKRPVSNPGQTCDALVQSALDGGGEDNVSVIVVQLTDSQNAKPMPRIELLAKPEKLQMPPM
jgi:serine/threonine protein phosphatase PrpC